MSLPFATENNSKSSNILPQQWVTAQLRFPVFLPFLLATRTLGETHGSPLSNHSSRACSLAFVPWINRTSHAPAWSPKECLALAIPKSYLWSFLPRHGPKSTPWALYPQLITWKWTRRVLIYYPKKICEILETMSSPLNKHPIISTAIIILKTIHYYFSDNYCIMPYYQCSQ